MFRHCNEEYHYMVISNIFAFKLKAMDDGKGCRFLLFWHHSYEVTLIYLKREFDVQKLIKILKKLCSEEVKDHDKNDFLGPLSSMALSLTIGLNRLIEHFIDSEMLQ